MINKQRLNELENVFAQNFLKLITERADIDIQECVESKLKIIVNKAARKEFAKYIELIEEATSELNEIDRECRARLRLLDSKLEQFQKYESVECADYYHAFIKSEIERQLKDKQ